MGLAAEPDPQGVEFFEKKIRPVLVERCYKCHSAQAQPAKGGLLLDSRSGWQTGGDSGPAIDPGKLDTSLLLQAIRYEGLEMPPDGKLPAAVIADFETWIRRGAPDPRDGTGPPARPGLDLKAARQFWSLQPVRRPPLPAVRNAAWPQSPVDHFVLAKLEQQGLSPSPPADKPTLLRRATYDLIGLPPTLEEIEAFLGDDSPGAFARVVDRLLASPHYGERWGRHWLDLARYGEDQAHTFQAQLYPNGYLYRDWVARALNNGMPYDRFVREQIAADLLPGMDRIEQLPALGLFALGPVYYQSNQEKARATADQWDDRIDTLTRGILGLTVACARCHDHKFDPVTTADYYSLAGIFASTNYQEAPVSPHAVIERRRQADEAVKAQQQRIEELVRRHAPELRVKLAGESSRYLRAAWRALNREKRGIRSRTAVAEVAKDEKLSEPLLRRWYDALKPEGPAELAELRVLIAAQDLNRDLGRDEAAVAAVSAAAETFQQRLDAVLPERGRLFERFGQDVAFAESKSEAPVRSAGEGESTGGSTGDRARQDALLLSRLLADEGILALSPQDAEPLLQGEAKDQVAELKRERDRLQKAAEEIQILKAHAITDGTPRDLPIYRQGDPARPGETAPRGFLAVLAREDSKPEAFEGSGRLELASAVTDPANPLTARVVVNRVWHHHFGFGIVRTPSNFGNLGERPSHPQLLDWLASELVASGWSLKALHRQLMLSAVYQQSSGPNARGSDVDPENRLLGRMHRRRLEVEPWRDAMLAVSGTLDRTLGGPSFDLASADGHRRTYYGAVSRHRLNDLLRLFDFPDPNITSDRRTVTTVPLQQLFVLNSEFMVRQARALAARVEAETSDDSQRVRRAYLLLYSRQPSDDEMRLGIEFLRSAAEASDATGDLSPWQQYALALLGANEFAFID
jgi:hypothetical protein